MLNPMTWNNLDDLTSPKRRTIQCQIQWNTTQIHYCYEFSTTKHCVTPNHCSTATKWQANTGNNGPFKDLSGHWAFWRKQDQCCKVGQGHCVGWLLVGEGILTIKIMDHIISLMKFAETNQGILGDVYKWWDSTIKCVKTIIIENECPEYGTPIELLFNTIQDILVKR